MSTNAKTDPTGEHIAPFTLYIGIAFTLVVLTGLTVAVSFVHLGGWNVVVALLIASLKGSLVALFFMHLYYDKKIYSIVFSMGLLFLSIFLALTLFDTLRRGEIYTIKAEPIDKEAVIYKNRPAPDSSEFQDESGH